MTILFSIFVFHNFKRKAIYQTTPYPVKRLLYSDFAYKE